MDRRVVIGCDHGGLDLKLAIIAFLQKSKYEVTDVGTNSKESCDYPDYALAVAKKVSDGDFARGMVICTSGIGVCITANKVRGVRAALCTSVEQAELSRKHNDSNVLGLSGKFTAVELALKICETWLKAEFEYGRHERRVNKIKQFENRNNGN